MLVSDLNDTMYYTCVHMEEDWVGDWQNKQMVRAYCKESLKILHFLLAKITYLYVKVLCNANFDHAVRCTFQSILTPKGK